MSRKNGLCRAHKAELLTGIQRANALSRTQPGWLQNGLAEEIMHDLDRTTLEMELGGEAFETGFEGEAEVGEVPFNETEAMELASELLSVTSEQELNNFLGSLAKRAWSGINKAASSPVGQQLVGGLKAIAKKALPVVGAAVGNYVAPGVGGAMGARLATAAGSAFGLELEGLSAEDQEFEVAKQFVQLAGRAAQNVAKVPAGPVPSETAKTAIVDAAKKFAPGLVAVLARSTPAGTRAAPTPAGRPTSGRWVRRGSTIVILGV